VKPHQREWRRFNFAETFRNEADDAADEPEAEQARQEAKEPPPANTVPTAQG